jgi:hypothetical protein
MRCQPSPPWLGASSAPPRIHHPVTTPSPRGPPRKTAGHRERRASRGPAGNEGAARDAGRIHRMASHFSINDSVPGPTYPERPALAGTTGARINQAPNTSVLVLCRGNRDEVSHERDPVDHGLAGVLSGATGRSHPQFHDTACRMPCSTEMFSVADSHHMGGQPKEKPHRDPTSHQDSRGCGG